MVSEFCEKISNIAYVNRSVQEYLIKHGFSAFSACIDYDHKNMSEDEREAFEPCMEELIKVSIANGSRNLSYWGKNSAHSLVLDEFFRKLWLDGMGYWFSPLPWHVRDWRLQQENPEAYYFQRGELHTVIWNMIAEESLRFFCDDLLLDFDRMIDEFVVRAEMHGFKTSKKTRSGVVCEKKVNADISIFLDLKISRKSIGYISTNGGAKGMEIYLYAKYKKIPKHMGSQQKVIVFPVAFNVLGPYIDRVYTNFRNMPEFINAIEAHFFTFDAIKDALEKALGCFFDKNIKCI